ncbi:MAG: branched-chain amino acid ABC transporter permease [Chloroflexota bacterium]
MVLQNILRKSQVIVFIAGIALLVIAPWIISSQYIRHLIVVAMLYAVLASNWDLTLGYAGVFNFAHIAFFGLGAYSAGILSKTFGISPWICILAGGLVAVIASAAICLPVLRVRGLYVCLVTFAFGQLCLQIILSQSKYTGGSQGLVLIPPITIGSYSFLNNDKIAYYYLVLLLFIISIVYLRRLVGSYFGLSVVALRDFESYAISRGVPLARQRLLTFIASAVMTGITGAVYAFYLGVVSPDLFGFGYTVTLLSMILLGGIGTIYGSLIGAVVLTFVSEFMVSLGPWRFLIISTIIVLVMMFFPEGILSAVKRLAGSMSKSKTSVQEIKGV